MQKMPVSITKASESGAAVRFDSNLADLLQIDSGSTLPDDSVALKSLLIRLAQQSREKVGALENQVHARLDDLIQAKIQEQVQAQVQAQLQVELKVQLAIKLQEIFEQMRLQRLRLYGPSSEINPLQGRLFDEAEALLSEPQSDGATEQEAAVQDATPSARGPVASPRGKRQPLPSELERVDIVHDVPEQERVCECGTPMVLIGQEVSEQLDIIPMQIRVLRHIRPRYGCPKGEQAPVIAPQAAQVLPKSNASPGFLAMLLTTKYADGVPLARFETILARHGAQVPRQTLARWVIGAAQALQPLSNLMRDVLLESDLIHIDETRVQVLKEPGRDPTAQSFMWVQKGGPPDKPVILFDYDPSRSAQVPIRLLQGWQGYLMTDGYQGYNALARLPGIEHLACWVHARRKFVEAIKVQSKGKRSRADQAIEMIGELYAIERTIKNLSALERFAMRQTESLPVLAKIRDWLDRALPGAPPKTALGSALHYLHHSWPGLIRYVERGDLPIDNNPVENAIRPFVIGRKNWLFADTQAGAHASALIYSVLETAKANGHEPYLWLRHILNALPSAKKVEHYEQLLPWNIKPLDLASNPKF
jgi:transposase